MAAPRPLHFCAFHMRSACSTFQSGASRKGDRWTHGRSRSQRVQLVSAACFEMKNHREMRRDESRRRRSHSIIINVAVGREGRRGEGGERRRKKQARHVAALPRARFVSNGAGEIDFLRSLLRRCSLLAHNMQRSRFSRLAVGHGRFLLHSLIILNILPTP